MLRNTFRLSKDIDSSDVRRVRLALWQYRATFCLQKQSGKASFYPFECTFSYSIVWGKVVVGSWPYLRLDYDHNADEFVNNPSQTTRRLSSLAHTLKRATKHTEWNLLEFLSTRATVMCKMWVHFTAEGAGDCEERLAAIVAVSVLAWIGRSVFIAKYLFKFMNNCTHTLTSPWILLINL